MKRVMQEFIITEISAVDRPAQEYATATILKQMLMNRSDRFAKEIDPLAEPANFEEAVAYIRRNDRTVKRTQAMSLARGFYPALYAEEQKTGASKYQMAVRKMRALKGTEQSALKFMMLVDRHILKNGGSRTAAMSAVRQAYPSEFAALQPKS